LISHSLKCVCDRDDDDEDEDEEEETVAAIEPQTTRDGPPPEGGVKPEPDEELPAKKKSKDKPPANELHTYGVPELSKFQKRELVADAEYLDGRPS
jgi:structural maintenance of chromosome 4